VALAQSATFEMESGDEEGGTSPESRKKKKKKEKKKKMGENGSGISPSRSPRGGADSSAAGVVPPHGDMMVVDDTFDNPLVFELEDGASNGASNGAAPKGKRERMKEAAAAGTAVQRMKSGKLAEGARRKAMEERWEEAGGGVAAVPAAAVRPPALAAALAFNGVASNGAAGGEEEEDLDGDRTAET
jgi:hypothetical protein